MAMNILLRIWTGIVAATTGAALAFLVQIAGMMAFGLPVEYLIGLAAAFAVVGFLIGFIAGPRTPRKSPTD